MDPNSTALIIALALRKFDSVAPTSYPPPSHSIFILQKSICLEPTLPSPSLIARTTHTIPRQHLLPHRRPLVRPLNPRSMYVRLASGGSRRVDTLLVILASTLASGTTSARSPGAKRGVRVKITCNSSKYFIFKHPIGIDRTYVAIAFTSHPALDALQCGLAGLGPQSGSLRKPTSRSYRPRRILRSSLRLP